jgi:hypothetical protein
MSIRLIQRYINGEPNPSSPVALTLGHMAADRPLEMNVEPSFDIS